MNASSQHIKIRKNKKLEYFHEVTALPILLLTLLFTALVTLSPAKAAETVACTGHNLLPDMQKNQPAAYAKMLSEAAKVENGDAIFWRIDKPGMKPSWLLGTMHVTDPRVLTMPPQADSARQAADTIIVESDDILDEKKAAAALLSQPQLSTFTDGTTLSGLLSAEDAHILDEALKQKGLSLQAVNKLKPWILSGLIALPACEVARKTAGAGFLDKIIAQEAANSGKRVAGVETFAEQLAAMNDLPLDFHMKSLMQSVKLGRKMDDISETMTVLYLQGKVGEILPMLSAIAPEDETDTAEFEKRIITDRNAVMAAKGGPILQNGNVFMAVGALHLPGEKGLVALLRAQGFTLTPIR